MCSRVCVLDDGPESGQRALLGGVLAMLWLLSGRLVAISTTSTLYNSMKASWIRHVPGNTVTRQHGFALISCPPWSVSVPTSGHVLALTFWSQDWDCGRVQSLEVTWVVVSCVSSWVVAPVSPRHFQLRVRTDG